PSHDDDGAPLGGVSGRAHPKRARLSGSGSPIPSPPDSVGLAPVRMGLLSLEHASLRFGGIVALDDVSLDVDEGTIAGLIGPNGAGKTTAFNVITRLYRVDSGDVLFDGHSLLHTPSSRVVKFGIARTFQNVELFPNMSVLENVLVGAHTISRFQSERAMRARAVETLELV